VQIRNVKVSINSVVLLVYIDLDLCHLKLSFSESELCGHVLRYLE